MWREIGGGVQRADFGFEEGQGWRLEAAGENLAGLCNRARSKAAPCEVGGGLTGCLACCRNGASYADTSLLLLACISCKDRHGKSTSPLTSPPQSPAQPSPLTSPVHSQALPTAPPSLSPQAPPRTCRACAPPPVAPPAPVLPLRDAVRLQLRRRALLALRGRVRAAAGRPLAGHLARRQGAGARASKEGLRLLAAGGHGAGLLGRCPVSPCGPAGGGGVKMGAPGREMWSARGKVTGRLGPVAAGWGWRYEVVGVVVEMCLSVQR